MPIYEYTCKDCETQFEKFVRSMTAEVKVKCPHCGGTLVIMNKNNAKCLACETVTPLDELEMANPVTEDFEVYQVEEA